MKKIIRAQLSGNKRYTDWSEVLAIKTDKEMAANYKEAYIISLENKLILIVLSGGVICFTLYDKCIKK